MRVRRADGVTVVKGADGKIATNISSGAISGPGATVTLETIWGDSEVDISDLNAGVRAAYQEGQCWSLAAELAVRVPDGRVGIVLRDCDVFDDELDGVWGADLDDYPGMWEDPDWLESATHVVAVDRYGWLYDVNGQHDSEGMKEVAEASWGAWHMVCLDVSDYLDLLGNVGYRFAPEQDFDAAAAVADLVVAETGYAQSSVSVDRYDWRTVADFMSSDFADDVQGITEMPPEQLRGMCEAANGAFAAWMEANGAADVRVADFVSLEGAPVGEGYPHTVCIIGDEVIDLTYGQIEADADMPTVVPLSRWSEQWRMLGEVSGAEALEDFQVPWR